MTAIITSLINASLPVIVYFLGKYVENKQSDDELAASFERFKVALDKSSGKIAAESQDIETRL